MNACRVRGAHCALSLALRFSSSAQTAPNLTVHSLLLPLRSQAIIILKVYGTSAELFTTEGFSQSDRPVQSRPTPKNQAESRRTFNLDHQLEGLHWLLTRRVKYIETNPR